jgi:glycosyltransferase involved in cell wall biosynthesis
MKKILILHTSTVMGGAEYSLLELLRNLDDKSASLHIACSTEQPLFRYVRSLHVHVHDVYLPYLRRKHPFRTWMEILKVSVKLYHLARKEKFQVIYCNTFRSLPFCLFIKWFCKSKIVCHCRDYIPSRSVRFMIRIVADECIAVSGNIFRELPRSSKIHIIHNGVNPLYFQKGDTSKFLLNQYSLPEQTQLIGNIGQITLWKNQMDYLAIASSLLCGRKNLHFFLVGAVVEHGYFLMLKQEIRRLGLEPHVTFTGHVENIVDYLSGFTLVLHTARNEPFGRVLIEAAASEKTVVSYTSGGPSEIIENGKTGFLVTDGDIETMAELTAMLLDNPNLRTIMGQSAGKHVARHFNSMDYARKVYQILNQD